MNLINFTWSGTGAWGPDAAKKLNAMCDAINQLNAVFGKGFLVSKGALGSSVSLASDTNGASAAAQNVEALPATPPSQVSSGGGFTLTLQPDSSSSGSSSSGDGSSGGSGDGGSASAPPAVADPVKIRVQVEPVDVCDGNTPVRKWFITAVDVENE